MAHLAFYISTQVPASHPDPEMQGFREAFLRAIPIAYAEAEKSPGLVAHANQIEWDDAKSEFEQNYGPWGKFAVPRHFTGRRGLGVRELSQSLSVWTCFEALYSYAYDGTHGEVLKVSRKKFKLEFYAVAWWIPESTVPTWEDAVRRLHYLEENGPSAEGFDVKRPLDEHGDRARLNPQKMAALRKHSVHEEIPL